MKEDIDKVTFNEDTLLIKESIEFELRVLQLLSRWLYVIRNCEYDTSKCALKECINSEIICEKRKQLDCEDCQIKWARITVDEMMNKEGK